MVPYDHIKRCMGQWVICHTRQQGVIRGRLTACNHTHIFLQVPRYSMVSQEQQEGEHALDVVYAVGDFDNFTQVSYGYGYGFGYGRTAVALASVVGLTAIGLTALW